jgi:hypothetical protein
MRREQNILEVEIEIHFQDCAVLEAGELSHGRSSASPEKRVRSG